MSDPVIVPPMPAQPVPAPMPWLAKLTDVVVILTGVTLIVFCWTFKEAPTAQPPDTPPPATKPNDKPPVVTPPVVTPPVTPVKPPPPPVVLSQLASTTIAYRDSLAASFDEAVAKLDDTTAIKTGSDAEVLLRSHGLSLVNAMRNTNAVYCQGGDPTQPITNREGLKAEYRAVAKALRAVPGQVQP